MPTTVSIIAGHRRIPVPPLAAGEAPIVPASRLVLEIEGDGVPAEIDINGERHPVIRTDDATRGHTIIDPFRSTGFQRFQLHGETYCFGTADAKLELDGILDILEIIGREGLSWGHQLIFSSGTAIRDARVDYAWLRTVGEAIIEACRAIADQPASVITVEPGLQRPRGGRPHISKTLSKIRANPGAMLEEHEHGLFEAHGRRFMPRKVVAFARNVTYDTIANRRATRLLLATADLAAYVAQSRDIPTQHERWLATLTREVHRLLSDFPFNALIRAADRIPDSPSITELRDPRYELTYRLHEELVTERGWEPGRNVADRFAYVGYSDQIYQAFVAVLLANAYHADRIVPYLRADLDHPSFRSERWDIYYDTAPPAPQYTSWRDKSSRPARLTPDYCIIDRLEHRGLLGDAKYRGNGNGGRLPGSSLNDCQVYMQHFDIRTFAVFYPGPDRLIEAISGDGYTILEVSVTPFDGVADWVATAVRPRLDELMEGIAH